MIEKISYKDIPDHLFKEEGKEKFSLYPFPFDGIAFHKQRWSAMDETKVHFFGITENGKIAAVIEFHFSDYDTRLLGVKAGTIQYILTDPQLDSENRRRIWKKLIESFQQYRKQENIQFCFFTLNNWESNLSILMQEHGFRYILTWGKCFVQQTTGLKLPEGYTVKKEKKEADLLLILEMSKDYFKGGRFYLDARIGAEKADTLYRDVIISNFQNPTTDFVVLYNEVGLPVGCFVARRINYQFDKTLNVASLRLLVYNKNKAARGVASGFLSVTSDLLLKEVPVVESGIEMHNLPSFKIHSNAGYKINHIFSAYHSWL